jgi:hypothetical protein
MRIWRNSTYVVLAAGMLAVLIGPLRAETVQANVAAFRPTTGTEAWGYVTEVGNDDSRATDMGFTHGDDSLNSYWRVDLEGVYTVDHLDIFCRMGYPSRTNGATLRAFAADGTTQIGSNVVLSGYSSSVSMQSVTNGGGPWTGVKYFQIGGTGLAPQYLHLGEFAAYASVETYPDYISGVTATAVNGYPMSILDPMSLVNGRGMNDQGPGIGSPDALHYNVLADGTWHSDGSANTPVITFDLGESHSLANMVIWNQHQTYEGPGARCTKECLIEVSTDGTNYAPLDDTNGEDLGNYTLNPNDGLGGPYAATDNLGLGGLAASHVRLTILSSYGSPYVGLDAVRFYAVPEPSTLVLLILGSLVVLGRRK